MKKLLRSALAIVLCVLMLPVAAIQNTSAVSEKEFEKTVKRSVILYLNKGNILLYGEKGYISDNREITPYKNGEDIYLPVDFYADSIEATVSEASDGKIKITAGKKSAEFAVEKGNGDALYAKANELCGAFSYNWYADKNGIIAYSKQDLNEVFDWTENLHLLRAKLSEFLFDDVSGEELYSLLLQNNPNKNHPRLLVNDEEWAQIRESNDGIYNYLKNNIKKSANSYLRTKTSVYEIRDGIRLLYVSREAQDCIIACSLMYQLTLEDKYAQRAYDEMAAVCAFPNWNPKHYLDVGVMSAGVAIGYDLIYNWMTPDQRATIRKGIETHVIPTILDDINGCIGDRTYQWYKEGNINNWRCVCAGGVGVAMLAMMDEFEGEALENAKIIVPKMLEAVRPTMMLFAPYGAFEEGFGYWEFAMQNYSYFMKSLEMTTGNDFGYVDLPGMNLTHEYFISANGPVQIFNYHNAGSTMESFYPPQLLYLADKFDAPETTSFVLERIRASKWGTSGRFDDIFYYDISMNQKFEKEVMYDGYFPVTEIATMRNGTKKTSTFVGLHCDRPFGNGTTGGEHMDAGQFQIQAQGQVWFMDLGSNDYNVSDLHNTYRFRAEGHNTVIFNPDYDFAMKKNGTCYVSDYGFDTDYSYAVGNMTDAYNKEEGVTSFLRGIKLDKEKGYVTVQDEIRLKDSADMYWFAHTDADITLSDDKKSATLTKAGRTIHAYIVNGDAATFSVMEAKPLPTSPKVPDQEAVASNVKKLTIHIEKCKDIDLCVVFATSSAYSKVGVYEFSNISEWKKVPAAEDITTPDTTDTSVDTDVNVDTPAPASKLPVIIGIGAAVVAAIGVVATVLFKKKKRK